MNLKEISDNIKKELSQSQSLTELDSLRKKYLGKKGILSCLFKSLPRENKNDFQKVNQIKKELENGIKEKKKTVGSLNEIKEEVDVTLPGIKTETGTLHPLTKGIKDCLEIFEKMGFVIATGSELENEWYNFDALNFPPNHPAREMQDTFFVKQKETNSSRERLLLRTHTSPVQVRYMEKNEPPLRIVVPGRVFRNEATDASHETSFYQIEGLMIDKDISIANFKAVIQEFCQIFFSKQAKTRIRPSFFPFTEPSFEIDMTCAICQGKKCSFCSNTGWIEIMGAGMVHPKVLENSGLDSSRWQGFAFGMGDRIIMLKHKINDARLFYSGDLRFLKQF